MSKVSHSTYFKWMFHQRSRADPIGDLARDAFQDTEWNGTMKSLIGRIKDEDAIISTDKARDAYVESVKEFRDQKVQYYKGVTI